MASSKSKMSPWHAHKKDLMTQNEDDEVVEQSNEPNWSYAPYILGKNQLCQYSRPEEDEDGLSSDVVRYQKLDNADELGLCQTRSREDMSSPELEPTDPPNESIIILESKPDGNTINTTVDEGQEKTQVQDDSLLDKLESFQNYSLSQTFTLHQSFQAILSDIKQQEMLAGSCPGEDGVAAPSETTTEMQMSEAPVSEVPEQAGMEYHVGQIIKVEQPASVGPSPSSEHSDPTHSADDRKHQPVYQVTEQYMGGSKISHAVDTKENSPQIHAALNTIEDRKPVYHVTQQYMGGGENALAEDTKEHSPQLQAALNTIAAVSPKEHLDKTTEFSAKVRNPKRKRQPSPHNTAVNLAIVKTESANTSILNDPLTSHLPSAEVHQPSMLAVVKPEHLSGLNLVKDKPHTESDLKTSKDNPTSSLEMKMTSIESFNHPGLPHIPTTQFQWQNFTNYWKPNNMVPPWISVNGQPPFQSLPAVEEGSTPGKSQLGVIANANPKIITEVIEQTITRTIKETPEISVHPSKEQDKPTKAKSSKNTCKDVKLGLKAIAPKQSPKQCTPSSESLSKLTYFGLSPISESTPKMEHHISRTKLSPSGIPKFPDSTPELHKSLKRTESPNHRTHSGILAESTPENHHHAPNSKFSPNFPDISGRISPFSDHYYLPPPAHQHRQASPTHFHPQFRQTSPTGYWPQAPAHQHPPGMGMDMYQYGQNPYQSFCNPMYSNPYMNPMHQSMMYSTNPLYQQYTGHPSHQIPPFGISPYPAHLMNAHQPDVHSEKDNVTQGPVKQEKNSESRGLTLPVQQPASVDNSKKVYSSPDKTRRQQGQNEGSIALTIKTALQDHERTNKLSFHGAPLENNPANDAHDALNAYEESAFGSHESHQHQLKPPPSHPLNTLSHPHSATSHSHSATSHSHSATSHSQSATSHPHSAPSHPHSAPSHPNTATYHPHSAPTHPNTAPSHPHSVHSLVAQNNTEYTPNRTSHVNNTSYNPNAPANVHASQMGYPPYTHPAYPIANAFGQHNANSHVSQSTNQGNQPPFSTNTVTPHNSNMTSQSANSIQNPSANHMIYSSANQTTIANHQNHAPFSNTNHGAFLPHTTFYDPKEFVANQNPNQAGKPGIQQGIQQSNMESYDVTTTTDAQADSASQVDSSTDTIQDSMIEESSSVFTKPDKSRRKGRINYSTKQLHAMDCVFALEPYPGIDKLDKLSVDLEIPVSKIKVWFQNKRARARKKGPEKSTSTTEKATEIYKNLMSYRPPSIVPPAVGLPPPNFNSLPGYPPNFNVPYPNPHHGFNLSHSNGECK